MSPSEIDENFFNTDKSDYESSALILGNQKPALFDTVHKLYPDIWSLYKQQKSQAWSESEFDYSSCARDMKDCDRDIYHLFTSTLAWQWETDSGFCGIGPLLRPFISSTELWAAWQAVSDMESVHSATYSEIVRNGYDDPSLVIQEIMQNQDVHQRLKVVGDVLGKLEQQGHRYALGLIPNDQELYNDVMNGIVALFLGERCQFMAAFAVTFAIGELGLFLPAVKSIQLIARDELLVHSELDKAVIEHEMKTKRGKIWLKSQKHHLKEMADSVVASELRWIHKLFDGRAIVGLTEDGLQQWTEYCSGPIYKTLGITPAVAIPYFNPLKFMNNWLDLSKNQPSPQEEAITSYKIAATVNDDAGKVFDF